MEPWELRGIQDQLVKCYAHLNKTGEDWHLYVNPCCYAFNTYVSPSTRYLGFELIYLHKPADLTDIE